MICSEPFGYLNLTICPEGLYSPVAKYFGVRFKIRIKIGNELVLHFNPWVEASAGGMLVPEALYSPVTKYFGTCFKKKKKKSKFDKFI
jgi:hypothetical protein